MLGTEERWLNLRIQTYFLLQIVLTSSLKGMGPGRMKFPGPTVASKYYFFLT